jgi:alpha-beta hydrolase superfamily lysophospholipase
MGGLLVLSFAIRNNKLKLAGLVVTSSLLGFPKDRKMGWFKAWLIKKIGKKLEDVVVNSMIHPTSLTKND